MTHKILLLSLLIFALTSCDLGGGEDSPLPGRTKDVSIVIQSPQAEFKSAASDAERMIDSATVVIFDRNGKYIDVKNINATGTRIACTFTGIKDTLFPVSVFVVANIGGTWEFASKPTWSSMTESELDGLVIQNGFSGKTLAKGTAPLPMCARTSSANGGKISVTLNRLVSRVSLANNSGISFDHVEFTNLNSGIQLTSPAIPVAANGGFSLQETGLAFTPGTTRNYYFMPTIGSEVTLKLKSGTIEKSAQLNRLGGNINHPVTITSDNIDINITISAPAEWGDDSEVTIK